MSREDMEVLDELRSDPECSHGELVINYPDEAPTNRNSATNYIGFRIPADERKQIERMAKEQDRSVGYIARQLIQMALNAIDQREHQKTAQGG